MKIALAFVFALLTAPVTYLHGVWSGHFLDLRSRDTFCGPGEPASPSMSWSWAPPSNRCNWADGTSTELVPWYVNPLILISLGIAAACVVQMVRLTQRNARRARRPSAEPVGQRRARRRGTEPVGPARSHEA